MMSARAATLQDRATHQSASLKTGFWLLLLAFAVRLLFLRLANNNGTDAWARFLIARTWLSHPTQLPSQVWLPLHFWLLGAALWVRDSELSARFMTLLFGAATVLPYWEMVRRIFDERVALWSTLLFALFGFHIGYSVTTSSEVPTIFFFVLGLYAWVRFSADHRLPLLVLSGLSFSAASLCRVEAWFYLPVLAIGTLFPSEGPAARPTRKTWVAAIVFGAAGSLGPGGWLLYSWIKWREPLHALKRSAWLSEHYNIHQPLLNRVVAVPGALVVTLSPVVGLLAVVGLFATFQRWRPVVIVPAILAIGLCAINFVLAVTKNSTMARYTLTYSWLLIPFAIFGVQFLCARWRLDTTASFASVLAFFLVWEAATLAGAYCAPPKIADKLSSVSPTLPLDVELRHLVRWLTTHRQPDDALIIDDFNYEASDIIRYAKVPASDVFQIPYEMAPETLQLQLRGFVEARHPRFLLYSPDGLLRRIGSPNELGTRLDGSEMTLSREWQEGNWQAYAISYRGTR